MCQSFTSCRLLIVRRRRLLVCTSPNPIAVGCRPCSQASSVRRLFTLPCAAKACTVAGFSEQSDQRLQQLALLAQLSFSIPGLATSYSLHLQKNSRLPRRVPTKHSLHRHRHSLHHSRPLPLSPASPVQSSRVVSPSFVVAVAVAVARRCRCCRDCFLLNTRSYHEEWASDDTPRAPTASSSAFCQLVGSPRIR